MSSYQKIQETFQKEYHTGSPLYKQRLIKWRKEPTVLKIERPTNLASARTRGYKAKKGFILVRVKIRKGKRKREKPNKGRKPSKYGRFFAPHKSLQAISEERAGKKFPGLEVLNSYWVGQDGSTKFFEVILADPKLTGLPLQRGRAFRGMTRAGRKGRGLYSNN